MTTTQLVLSTEPVKEEWRAIAGYEGLYEVSSLGRVRSLDRHVPNGPTSTRLRRGRVLRFKPRPDRYCAVSLSKDSVVVDYLVHQLVAQAFLPPDSIRTAVNHIDFDRANNRPDNLEWCTPLENIHHSGRAGRNVVKLTPDAVRRIRQCLASNTSTWREIAAAFGVSDSAIWGIATGRYWRHIK